MAPRFCNRCAQTLTPDATVCPRCNAPIVPAVRPAPSGPAAGGVVAATARRACANCHAAMRWIGHYSLRAAGRPGEGSGTAGDPGEVVETLLPFSLYYCQSCGKFDLYYPGT